MEEELDWYDYFAKDVLISGYNLEPVLKNPKSKGLTNSGFQGGRTKLNIADFDEKQLCLALDVVICHFHSTSKNNKQILSSYELKHLIERYLIARTHSRLNYISNGAAIVAMMYNGFDIERIPNTPNAIFKVSKRDLDGFLLQIKHYEDSHNKWMREKFTHS